MNTSRQIGGAIGLAAVSAVAATSTSGYVSSHAGIVATAAPALDHGFQSALYALTAVLVAGVVVAATLVRPRPRPVAAGQAAEQVPELDLVRDAA